MVFRLKEKTIILQRLYKDYVCYVEEISLIEEDYLWQNVSIYVDDPRSIQEFLIVHSPSSYSGGRSLSAYMTAENPSTIRKFAEVLKAMRDFRTHLQTSIEVEHYVRQFMRWLPSTYTVRYCRVDLKTFKLRCLHRKGAIRLTPDNIKKLKPSASSHFVKRIETAPVYGYVNKKGELVAMSGDGFLGKKSFAISYTETKPEYRCQGIAKCLTSLASEPLINKGLVGVYSTDITNEQSLRVARALGFLSYKDLMCFYN
jgi:ribosomal protein S18 acetylase RimI-like enzyme